MFISPLPLRERVGCGVAARLCGIVSSGSDNRLGYALYIAENIAVPKTENAEALILQPSITFNIRLNIRVLATIGLDNEAIFETHEVHNISVVDDLLPTPAQCAQPLVTQNMPKLPFRISRIGAHISRARFQKLMPRLKLCQSLVRR
jgi:hypothetical protein